MRGFFGDVEWRIQNPEGVNPVTSPSKNSTRKRLRMIWEGSGDLESVLDDPNRSRTPDMVHAFNELYDAAKNYDSTKPGKLLSCSSPAQSVF